MFRGPLAPLANEVIDEVFDFAKIGASWNEIFAPKLPFQADILISTEPKLRDTVLARRIRHERFISPALKFAFSEVKPTIKTDTAGSVVGRLQQLFELATGKIITLDCTLPISDELSNEAEKVLSAKNTYIGLSPGAGGQSKRWPLAAFLSIAHQQLALGRKPIFFIGPDEQHLMPEIRTSIPNAMFPEFDGDNRREGGALFSIALARRLHVSVANDAGGGHLLAAGGRPLISLYGHTSAEKFRPIYGPHHAICASEYGTTEMASIPTSAVSDAIEKMLRLEEIKI